MVTTSYFQKDTNSWYIHCSGKAIMKMKVKVKFGCLQNVCSFTMNGIIFHRNWLVAMKVVGLWVYSCACMDTWTHMHMMHFIMKLKMWAYWVGTIGGIIVEAVEAWVRLYYWGRREHDLEVRFHYLAFSLLLLYIEALLKVFSSYKMMAWNYQLLVLK
jgi:hypothetical protein